jgi:hypothetical protein
VVASNKRQHLQTTQGGRIAKNYLVSEIDMPTDQVCGSEPTTGGLNKFRATDHGKLVTGNRFKGFQKYKQD